ncbi:MAG: RHS repeat-associated core domain-containing protein, partial [Patescibacteria group bacterium]
TYDSVGNITQTVDNSLTDTAKTMVYGYDDLHRLTSAIATNATSTSPGNFTQTYAYDAIGDITNKSDIGNYLYQGTNYANPHAATSVNGVTYAYDNNGNLTSDSTWTHSWNYANQLTQSQKTGSTVTYQYDHTGQRTKYYDGASGYARHYPNKLYNIKQTTATKHIYAGSQLVATMEGSTLQYIHTDHLTGSNAATNSTGGMVQLLDYYPYGSMRIDWKSGTFDEQRKFTGHMYDRDTSLTYANARYYKQNVGRFLSQDSIYTHSPSVYLTDPQQANAYSYARNNPLRFIDTTGKKVSEYQPYLSSGSSYITGEILGNYRGVNVYSGGRLTGTGQHQYQCVDFTKNFVRSEYNINLAGTGHGYAYGNQSNINRAFQSNNPDNPGSYIVYGNGSTAMPQENDILSWSGGSYGHVGVIAEVTYDPDSGTGWVYTIEQNANRDQGIFYQSLTRTYDDQGRAIYTVESRIQGYDIQGWARYENQSRLNGPETSYTSTPYTPATKPPIEGNS